MPEAPAIPITHRQWTPRADFGTHFRAAWNRLDFRFFKFEALQFYDEGPESAFVDFAKGDFDTFVSKVAKARRLEAPMYAAAKDRGARFVRVHAVNLPPGDYLSYEAYSYCLSEILGESIYAISLEDAALILGGTPADFSVFDSHTAILNKYDNGTFLGTDLITDVTQVAHLNQLADELVATARPFREFLKIDEDLADQLLKAFNT